LTDNDPIIHILPNFCNPTKYGSEWRVSCRIGYAGCLPRDALATHMHSARCMLWPCIWHTLVLYRNGWTNRL